MDLNDKLGFGPAIEIADNRLGGIFAIRAGARGGRLKPQFSRRHHDQFVAQIFSERCVLKTAVRTVKRSAFQANRHVPLANPIKRELAPRSPAVADATLRGTGQLQWTLDVILEEMALDHLPVAQQLDHFDAILSL